jgi:hypothetical protein
MTYELRQNLNYSFGTLSTAAAISDTTLQSSDFSSLPSGASVSTTQYIPIVLQDPTAKVFEVVWINAHAAASTSVTVLRGREGTSARAWPSGTLWTAAPTVRDALLPVANRAALPAANDAHIGGRGLLLDEQRVVTRYAAGWLEPELIVGGIMRVTDDGDTSGFTERAVVTTGSISLEPNSIYMIVLAIYFLVATSGDKFDCQLRETNTTGTLLQAVNGTATSAANVNQHAIIHHPIVTGGSGTSKVYVGTLNRNNGSGVAHAKIGTHLLVKRLGHTSLLAQV